IDRGTSQGICRGVARNFRLSEVQEADIVDLAHDGRGVARVEGKALFIDGALPGDRVRFRLIKRRRQLDEAGLVDVLVASPGLVVPASAAVGRSAGCSPEPLTAPAQLAAKRRRVLDLPSLVR